MIANERKLKALAFQELLELDWVGRMYTHPGVNIKKIRSETRFGMKEVAIQGQATRDWNFSVFLLINVASLLTRQATRVNISTCGINANPRNPISFSLLDYWHQDACVSLLTTSILAIR